MVKNMSSCNTLRMVNLNEVVCQVLYSTDKLQTIWNIFYR